MKMAASAVLKHLRRRSTKLSVSPAGLAASFESPSLASSQRRRAYAGGSRNGAGNRGGARSSSIPSSEPSLSPPAPHCRPRKDGFLAWYLGSLEARPLVTKCVTSSLIYAAADLTSQMITLPPSSSLDLIRTLRMTAYGLVILGPSQHMWFNTVSRVLPKRDMVTTMKKIFMGQAIYGPCVTTVFFSYNAGLQGETFGDIVGRLRRDLLPTMRNGILFWPICDFFHIQVHPCAFTAIGEQFLCICMEHLFNIHGKLEKASSD